MKIYFNKPQLLSLAFSKQKMTFLNQNSGCCIYPTFDTHIQLELELSKSLTERDKKHQENIPL